MKPDIRINVLMLIFYIIGVAVCLWYLYGVAPMLNWGIVTVLSALSVVEAAFVLASFHMGKMPFRAHGNGDIILSNRAIWVANIPIIGGLWLLFPYAPIALLMVYTILSLAATCDFMIRSITRPPSRRFTWAGPSMILLSNALYAVIHPVPFPIVIAVTNLILCASFLMAKWQVQSLLYDLYMARIAAETARSEAEQSRDARLRFLSSASHDLRQPIQSARLFFDQVIRSPSVEARDKAVRGVNRAFEATEHILDQILNHLRLGANAVAVDIAPVAIGPLIAQVAETHESSAQLAGISIHAMPSRAVAQCDAILAMRALGNLVDNAIRHSRARRILIGARQQQDIVRIWVIDDGVGIAPSDLPHLFDEYVQGSDHRDEIRGGFGLGLASTSQMASLMQGHAGIEVGWEQGSAFYFDLVGERR